MKEKIRIGYIGLGRRGYAIIRDCLAQMKDVEFVTLCDQVPERMERAAKLLEENGKPRPTFTTDYKTILADPTIDAVFIMTGWNTHMEMTKASLLAGKYTGIEVGCAYDLQECFDLIDAYEQTKAPLMMLENCCYGRREMMALNILKQGLFGEIVHCRGGYLHYLPGTELLAETDPSHYRLTEYAQRNCEQYPTHELGPISKVLHINRGNRMMKLTSTASKARGLETYSERHLTSESSYPIQKYNQGDIVNTCITCAGGETILLTLDTTLPRAYYSRDFTVRGTLGMYMEERKVLFFEGMREEIANNEEEFFAKYDHPLHAEYTKLGEKAGHEGMDWLVCRAFVESVKRGVNTPIDAYDTVTWMSIAPLSEMSIQKGGAPVDIPDFTRGKWMRREPIVEGKYCLDDVCVDNETPIM
ncbi:MAG: Gfo/Idh/MocA family oxidoreductase [Lachnospiraceae bacterium]|nr:Gfo/Idh/MocA family oxidoreductase [Lachnospiraceae bacterium]